MKVPGIIRGLFVFLLPLLTFTVTTTVSAQTTPGIVGHIREASIPYGCCPTRITRGPDNNFYFSEPRLNQIGRITLSGRFTKYPIPPDNGGYPGGITTGPDGNL